LNGTVVGRRYGRPCNRHPARGPGVVHDEASAGIRAGVRSRTMTGREGEGGGGGEYEGGCLFDDDRDEDEYDDDNEYDDKEDGKGSRGGADDGGESDYDGRDVVRGPSFGSVGWRMSIYAPHAAATVIDDDDFDNDRHRGGGASCPPPSGPSRPAGRRSSLSMSPTAVDGGGTRAFGAWSYAGWRRKFRAVVLIRQVLIQPRVDDGGKRSGVTWWDYVA
jgi:hypothetical protein